MKHLLPRMVFVSAYRPTNTADQNHDAQFDLIKRIGRLEMKYIHCRGVYQGIGEASLGVVCERPWSVGRVYDLAKNYYSQDSALLREPDGSCWLLSNSSSQGDYIGQWSEITGGQATRLGGYTYYMGRFFAAR